nr:DUF4176 domain-containing protein [uncultured Cellulosilyticum sp.]
MEDVLFSVGKIVEANINDEYGMYLIIGKRVQNPRNMRVWDYIGVPYDEGYISNNKGDGLGYTNVVFFNHMDIKDGTK